MARKASDLMSLLAARGRGRSRARSTGIVQQFSAAIGSAFASVLPRRPDVHGRKAAQGSERLGLVAGAFVLVGVGYLLGSAFPWGVLGGARGGPELKADAGRSAGTGGIAPGMIGDDMSPLARDYYLTAAYREKAAALQAARHLRDHGLAKARPLPAKDGGGGDIFALVVYFDGAREAEQFKTLLQQVAAPDDTFARYRETANWPRLGSTEPAR